MKISFKYTTAFSWLVVLLLLPSEQARGQFTAQWLDIGDFHAAYLQSGARNETSSVPFDKDFPAIMRASAHVRAEAFWIGVKDWTNPRGEQEPYYVARVGPRDPGSEFVAPVQNLLIGKWEDTEVLVDGLVAFNRVTILDDIVEDLPADRMVHTIFNTSVGVTVDTKAYAYTNEYHDNYHIIEYTFTNTGNVDADAEIELEGQTLNDAMFYRIERYRGARASSWHGDGGQVWGKYNMIDVVGDGHAEYPVDFTAYYTWQGWDPTYTRFNNLGGAYLPGALTGDQWMQAEWDTVGRLSGATMIGRVVLEATLGDDPDYPEQPYTINYMDQDEPLASSGNADRDYYELAILGRQKQTVHPDVSPSRMWPHYADQIEPSGAFWNPTTNPSQGKQGGFAPTVAYGPYDLDFGESVTVVVAEGADGLSFDAAVAIGNAYKLSGTNENLVIQYDADGDGQVECGAPLTAEIYRTTYDYGSECLTKNQWVLTARDSLWQTFYRALDAYSASQSMTQYPVVVPPKPPRMFSVFGRADVVDIEWEPIEVPDHWELYRTDRAVDRLPYTCIAGCPGTPPLPGSATSYEDRDPQLQRGIDYFYYLVAVSGDQPVDADAITGTPDGQPLKSSRYFTQTYQPTTLKRAPGASVTDARIAPNPVNLAADNSIRFPGIEGEDRVAFFNIPGIATIRIFSETGELIQTIEHTDGSGDEIWNLTTEARQLLVSGIYIAVIENRDPDHPDFGRSAFVKFTVIR